MRALMGLIKDRHGTYYAQQRVPERLQEAVARVLKLDKPRLVFLKRSLGTKATKEANTRAKPVQMEFDRVLQSAEALLSAKPVRKSLSAIEIRRMKPQNRCLVPFNSFAEYAPEPNPETKKKNVVWFALNEDRPLFAFAGIWTIFNSDRGTKSKPVPGSHQVLLPDDRGECGRKADPSGRRCRSS
jgi:uncharacterized protein DUF6538/SOS response associated peptidase (SRAP)